MTSQIYDADIRLDLYLFGYHLLLIKKDPDPNLGFTVGTIDVREKGVGVSCLKEINPRALVLAQVHADMFTKEASNFAAAPPEHMAILDRLIEKYRDYDVPFPLAYAYDEFKKIQEFENAHQDRDKDVT